MRDHQQQHLHHQQFAPPRSRRVRLPSPPCSSGTASSLSQPICLDLAGPHPSLSRPLRLRVHNHLTRQQPVPATPIDLDALIRANDRHRLPVFSSSEELASSSDSEIGRFGGRRPAERGKTTAGGREHHQRRVCPLNKFPSVSTIYPDNSSLSLDDFELHKEQQQMSVNDSSRKERRVAQFSIGGGGASESEPEGGPRARTTAAKSRSAPRTPPQQQPKEGVPALEMLEEISPVLPRPNIREDLDVPPLPRPLQLGREWRPLQTSTLTDLRTQLPKTNPRFGPPARTCVKMGQAIPLDPPRSLFDPFFPQHCCPSAPPRPEQFNLPSALAKSFGIRGILFLQVSVSDSLLLVHVRNAALFLDRLPASCFVKVEIRRSLSNRKRTKYDHRFRAQRSFAVSDTCWPEFFEDFHFRVSGVHLKYGDKLGLSLFAAQRPDSGPELLGRMSFSLRKFFRLARQRHWEGVEPAQVCEGGYFLLPERLGLDSHLSQDNILHRKYYDEIGSSLSSTSSFGCPSPFRMMSEPEWPMPPALSRPPLLAPLLSAPSKGQQPSGQQQQHRQQLDSSQSSSSQSGIGCKRRPGPPAPLPSAATDTTSDFTSSVTCSTGPLALGDSFSSGCAEVGSNVPNGAVGRPELRLMAPAEEDDSRPRGQSQPPVDGGGKCRLHSGERTEDPQQKRGQSQQPTSCLDSADQQLAVRRVASFTFLPPNGAHQHMFQKRNSVAVGAAMSDRVQRKGNTLGPLGKTLHFLRSKLDFSLSASVLCPSREDCRLWQESFEALLANKYGCMLFREFLQSEFSEENLEFWLECEHFKRMKEGKKQTAQKARQIFNTFVREQAPKEVNLDSQTRMSTKTALEGGPLRAELFGQAQSKIEQLMAKDSYPRFLKSDAYLELLDELEGVRPRAPLLPNGGLLRVASAREGSGGGNSPRLATRSPSLSPALGLRRHNMRRNTCSPTSLQIPAIRE